MFCVSVTPDPMLAVSQFLGRFHPLVVHLPIGFLILSFLFECLSFFPKYKKLREAVYLSLMLGFFAAVLACITGYLLRQEGGYDEAVADVHQVLGIATAIFSFLLLVVLKFSKTIVAEKRKRKKFRLALFVPLILLLSFTGHWGGSLTHGEDFLSLQLPTEVEKNPLASIKTKTAQDSAIFYRDVIQPLLEARCYSCHSAKKQKGQLRLDAPEFIVRGGKHGDVLVPGLPDSSELYTRLMLPPEDEHHMPPSEKPQLSSTEIALIQAWIEEGANFEKFIADLKDPGRIHKYVNSYSEIAERPSDIPVEEIAEADKATVDQLKNLGVLVVPANETSHYLMINFVNARVINKEMLTTLRKLKDHVVWLNLGYTGINDTQCSSLSDLLRLRVLYLNHTAVTDTGLKNIKDLKELRYLNLVGTQVTDSTLEVLSGMKTLRNVYLFQTRVTHQAVQHFLEKSKTTVADTGNYTLNKLASDTIHYTQKL